MQYSAYRWRTTFLPLGVIAYAMVAMIGKPSSPVEIFPFFNWSLFSIAPSPAGLYMLEVTSLDGKKLSEPTAYYDLGNRFGDASKRDTRLIKALAQHDTAIQNGDTAAAQHIRALIETHYLREAEQVEYRLVRQTYDPITRFQTGEVMETQVLASYSKR